jgi:hypothetical protein
LGTRQASLVRRRRIADSGVSNVEPEEPMIRKIARLFKITSRFEACMLIYALALGAISRGMEYREHYPGWIGWLFFAACLGAVVLAGAKILDCLRLERAVGNGGGVAD